MDVIKEMIKGYVIDRTLLGAFCYLTENGITWEIEAIVRDEFRHMWE